MCKLRKNKLKEKEEINTAEMNDIKECRKTLYLAIKGPLVTLTQQNSVEYWEWKINCSE